MESRRKRESVIKVLRQLQRKACCYDMLVHKKPPSSCDCKYGGDDVNAATDSHGEETGCPELREAIYILEKIDNFVYDYILRGEK